MSRDRLRTLAPALGFVALVLVPLAIWGGSELFGEDEADLIVESLQPTVAGPEEIVVTLPSSDLNAPDTTGGEPSITLECLDAGEQVVIRIEHPFPFTDTDDGTLPPHVHQVVPPEVAELIETCRLEGTDPALEGRLEPAAAAR